MEQFNDYSCTVYGLKRFVVDDKKILLFSFRVQFKTFSCEAGHLRFLINKNTHALFWLNQVCCFR